jgi:hypothetical protein
VKITREMIEASGCRYGGVAELPVIAKSTRLALAAFRFRPLDALPGYG